MSLSPSAFAAWDLQQLMDSLAQHKSGRATFVETKRIAMLDKPVESLGELVFVAPDRLEKRTLKPKPESMIVDGDALTLERGGRRAGRPGNPTAIPDGRGRTHAADAGGDPEDLGAALWLSRAPA